MREAAAEAVKLGGGRGGVSATKPQSCSGGGGQSAEDTVGTQPWAELP